MITKVALAVLVGLPMLAGCAGQFSPDAAALHSAHPVSGGGTALLAGPFQAAGGSQRWSAVESGGRSMALVPSASAQGMPESLNSLPPGAANPY